MDVGRTAFMHQLFRIVGQVFYTQTRDQGVAGSSLTGGTALYH